MSKIEVVDLFCGIGGFTKGLNQSGLKVKAGFDIEQSCAFAYTANNNAKFICKDIRTVNADDVKKNYSKNSIKVLAGCAPCQPFSQMRFKYKDLNADDEKYNLLLEFGRLVQETDPDIVSMENVPKIRNTNVFKTFLNILNEKGYKVDYKVVYCPDYGIPQNRRRFLLLAAKKEIKLLSPTHNKTNYVTVRDTIGSLPPVSAGEVLKTDIMHQTAKLTDINLERIKMSKPGGTWKDWPEYLRCKCHQKASGATYSSVYGRMEWDKIAPTMTTQFYCYGTGRYGHPTQNRALTLREGALIQTFPLDYKFIDDNQKFSLKEVARAIGNAVPVKLGKIIGDSIKNYVKENKDFLKCVN